MIYLDNAATAMPLPCALAAAEDAMRTRFGNPSSVHAMGKAAREALESSRAAVANALGCKLERVTFTSGGTEASNTAIFGAATKNKHLGRHIVSTSVEHDATLSALNALKNQGFEVTLVSPERDGSVSAEKICDALRGDTILVAMQAVNNETGALMPFADAALELKRRRRGALFYLDAVQGLFKTALPLENIDLLAASAHKIGGIKGAGALYCAGGLTLRPLLHGGGQEGGTRSGTEAVPAIAAFGAAAEYRHENMRSDCAQLAALKERLFCGLAEAGVPFLCNSPENSAPHIINISPQKGRSEVFIRLLSEVEICISGGSACKRGKRSQVLAAMGLGGAQIDSAIRVSLCPENTGADIDFFCAALANALKFF